MIHLDEDSLICDMAETYGVFDYRALPVRQASILANGLRDDSRIKLLMAGSKVSLETKLTAYIADILRILLHTHEKEGAPTPTMILPQLEEAEDDSVSFSSADDFMMARYGGSDG